MRLVIFYSILYFVIPSCYAQEFGPRASAMGEAGVAVCDEYSLSQNIASIAFLDQSSVSIFGDKRFLLDGLNESSASAALKIPSGFAGIHLSYYGFTDYYQLTTSVGYAIKVTENFSIGIQFDYLRTAISEYGAENVFTGEAGIFVKLTPSLQFGARVFNPFKIQNGYYESQKIPTTFAVGLAYYAGNNVLITADGEENLNDGARFHGGIQYDIFKQVDLRAGIETNPFTETFGIGVKWKGFSIDAASLIHPVLGVTPQIGIAHAF
jgi:hypothetical protein